MRILLVEPPLDGDQPAAFISNWDIFFPIGIGYVAAVLEAAGHDVELVDLQMRANPRALMRRRVRHGRYDLVGFSVTLASLDAVRELAQTCRRADFEGHVVVGGPYTTILGGEAVLASSPAFTHAVIGEGEETVVELVAALEGAGDLASVKSIAFRDGPDIIETPRRPLIRDLDSIPYPARHLYDMTLYRKLSPGQFLALPHLPILSSRGCPHHCRFCANDAMWRGRVRLRDPGSILEEMQHMVRVYGAREIKFYDDTLLVSRSRITRLCERILEQSFDVMWRCVARVDEVDRELLHLMRRAGCKVISFGIESGSDHILERMNKGITVQQTRDAVRWANEAGMLANGLFMLNYPGETRETTEATIALSQELDLHFAGFSLTMPMPAALRDEIREGYQLIEDAWQHPYYNGTQVFFVQSDLTEEYLLDAHARAAREFYLRPSFVRKSLSIMRNRDVMASYLRGFRRLLAIVGGPQHG